MKEQKIIIIVVLLATIFAVAPLAYAAYYPAQGLVPCGDPGEDPCTPCHLWKLSDNIVDFLLKWLALPILVVALLAGGIIWLSSVGNPGQIEKGKKIITSSIVGILIAFVGWLIVDTIITTLGQGELQWAWKEISNCPAGSSGSSSSSSTSIPSTATPPLTTGPTSNRCSGCSTLSVPSKPGACANTAQGQTCQVNSALNDRLVNMNREIINDGKPSYWQVTEAWPPTVTHQNPCHQNGTCVDANLIGNQNNANPNDVKYFINKAENNGLKPVYEVKTQERANQLKSQGVASQNIQVVPQITAEHFSVYMK